MAGKYDITCDQGSTFRRVFTLKNANAVLMDLTGYSARMQVREAFDSTGTLAAITNTTNAATVGRITMGGALGTVEPMIHELVMTAMPVGKFRWDIEIVSPSGEPTRILDGTFKVKAEVTR